MSDPPPSVCTCGHDWTQHYDGGGSLGPCLALAGDGTATVCPCQHFLLGMRKETRPMGLTDCICGHAIEEHEGENGPCTFTTGPHGHGRDETAAPGDPRRCGCLGYERDETGDEETE